MLLTFCLSKYDMYLTECSIGLFLGAYSKVWSVWHPLSESPLLVLSHYLFLITLAFTLLQIHYTSFTFGDASSQNACRIFLRILQLLYHPSMFLALAYWSCSAETEICLRHGHIDFWVLIIHLQHAEIGIDRKKVETNLFEKKKKPVWKQQWTRKQSLLS